MNKPPISKEKKNETGKRTKNGRKKDDVSYYNNLKICSFLPA